MSELASDSVPEFLGSSFMMDNNSYLGSGNV